MNNFIGRTESTVNKENRMNKFNEGTVHGNGESGSSEEQKGSGSTSGEIHLVQGDKKVDAISRPTPKATSPRTLAGKERSKHNATRHGIFSSVAVLSSESRKDYDRLLDRLRHSLQPVGEIEEILVEKLATILWRQRRLVIAEAAEIRRSQEFVEWDRTQQQELEAEKQSSRLRKNRFARAISFSLD